MKQENEYGILKTLVFRPVAAKAANPELEALKVFIFAPDAESAIDKARAALRLSRDDWKLARISEEKDPVS